VILFSGILSYRCCTVVFCRSLRVVAEGERGQTQRNAFTAGPTFFSGCFTLISVYLVTAIVVVLLSAQFRLLKFAALLGVFLFCCFCGRFRCYCFTLDELTMSHRFKCRKIARKGENLSLRLL